MRTKSAPSIPEQTLWSLETITKNPHSKKTKKRLQRLLSSWASRADAKAPTLKTGKTSWTGTEPLNERSKWSRPNESSSSLTTARCLTIAPWRTSSSERRRSSRSRNINACTPKNGYMNLLVCNAKQIVFICGWIATTHVICNTDSLLNS